jgi:hypothetical protein
VSKNGPHRAAKNNGWTRPDPQNEKIDMGRLPYQLVHQDSPWGAYRDREIWEVEAYGSHDLLKSGKNTFFPLLFLTY